MPIDYQLPDFDLHAFFNEVHNEIVKSTKKKLEKTARALTKQVAANIRAQDFNPQLPPLAQSTIDRKQGSDLFIDTGAYLDAIEAKSNDNEVSINLNDIPHPNGRGKSMVDIATILEYGTDNGHIPPRPHWRPVYAQVIADQEKEKERLAKVMKKGAAKGAAKFTKEKVESSPEVDLDDMTWEEREAYDKAQMERMSKQAIYNASPEKEEDNRTTKEKKAAIKKYLKEVQEKSKQERIAKREAHKAKFRKPKST